MRMEDLDGPRVKEGAAAQALDILAWLGLDWVGEPLVQSRSLGPSIEAMQTLCDRGMVYPCALSRAEIAAASTAPHDTSLSIREESVCPASIRPESMPDRFDDQGMNWRFATPSSPEGEVVFLDRVLGEQRVVPSQSVGDFVVWTQRGEPSYQLACVVDDALQGVTHVVRGNDLVDSTGRQVLLYRALGLTPEPEYWHLPLVIGSDGRRLAKRHGDTRLASYRESRVSPERIIGLLGRYHGVEPGPSGLLSACEFASGFDSAALSPEPIVFTQEDHRWILDGTG